MNNPRSNIITTKISRDTSNRNNKISNQNITKHIQKSNVVPPRKSKNITKITVDKRNLKMDYNSSNYYYDDNEKEEENEDEPYEDYQYGSNKIEYYDKNSKEGKYNHETNDSHITVEQEDGNTQRVPKKYMEYNMGNQPYIYKNENDNYDYYEENSDDSGNGYDRDNGDNDNEDGNDNEQGEIYYANENEEYEQDIIEQQFSNKNYNQYQNINKYYLSQNKNNNAKKSKKANKNVISRPINHQVNYTNDSKRKGRTPAGMHNYGNNSTTTNNTYNNNIYYINPVSMKNKDKKEEGQKFKKVNSKKNAVSKNVDITLNKRKINKEKDYFKMHNIRQSDRALYIKSAILIQSIFRAFLVKVKMFNNVNLYVCCKRGIDILENLILNWKKYFWKKYKSFYFNLYNNFFNSNLSFNILKQYLLTKTNFTEKKNTDFHKELGDSFNIINKKENSEVKLKSKLNDMIKENKELKNQLVDSKNVEEKIKNLIDENKKNQNINAIIMKDNQQLAKKLKDFQDYRNTNLIVENQPALDLTQKELIEIDELIKKNDVYNNILKKMQLEKIINKKINEGKFFLKSKFNELKNIVKDMKIKEKEKNLKKNIYIKNLVYIISNQIKLKRINTFKEIYYKSIIINIQNKSKNDLKIEILKNILIKKEQNRKSALLKSFIKIYYNKSQSKSELSKSDEENNNELKQTLLNKIVKNYDNNRKSLLKIFMEKWGLKSKILGMRAAARDKKKKRKLKKKNNKLISQKHYGLVDKNKQKNEFMTPIFSKSNHEFSYIVSNGVVIKESSSNETGRINLKNNKCSISSDKVNKLSNKLEKKDKGLKKINSFNEMIFKNNIKKEDSKNDTKENIISNNEESDEDSGDSLGLGNNSD